ncbi:nucleotide-binding universal stress UspA family protein [Pseudorhizobium tarimense]|uniref:Nucleotide-binding universal stress UspA family protein n=1 Tax=Pseudorhizobium tarimense TaxID=1079109 RepID=A0ABV2H7L5_9HYPH|nr:universal stress protein [Pseudorhizobium tarimense]MCJ8519623.1 universal stress protein [Pseudorhizobium tarimense]
MVLLPQDKAPTLQPKRIVVGWNDRVEAARAIRESLDLLKGAETVHVVMVDPQSPYGDNDGEPGAEIATYLSRHDVNVSVDQLPSGGGDVAEVISAHAADVSADMIVLGAYGHSRLRQRVFGGVTSSVLRQVQLPTLIAR